jgi:hypothetical protein
MRNLCGGIVSRPPPFTAELVNEGGRFGGKNLYCKFTAKNEEYARFLSINYTRFVNDADDLYSIQINYFDGRTFFQNIQTKSFNIIAENASSIIFHYYSNGFKTTSPFSAVFNIQDDEGQGYVGLGITIGVIVFICLICSLLFYKCSRVIIDNSNRQFQARRRIALNNRIPVEVTDSREDLQRINKEKLVQLYQNELKPVKFKPNINEFNSDCTICLEPFTESSDIMKLNCKHLFHHQCGKEWLEKNLINLKCPNCNYIITREKQHNPSLLLLNDNRAVHDNNEHRHSPIFRNSESRRNMSLDNLDSNNDNNDEQNNRSSVEMGNRNNLIVRGVDNNDANIR